MLDLGNVSQDCGETVLIINMNDQLKTEISFFYDQFPGWMLMTSSYSPVSGQAMAEASYGLSKEKIFEILNRTPLELPVFALNNLVLFPGQNDGFGLAALNVGRPLSVEILKKCRV